MAIIKLVVLPYYVVEQPEVSDEESAVRIFTKSGVRNLGVNSTD